MSGYKTDQRRLLHRGREFHFVSYEGHTADPRRSRPATAPSWCLMRAGKRWRVMEQIADLSDVELDRRLHEWLDANVFSSSTVSQPHARRHSPPLR